MENKYYTPAIEEFHVGFEYEEIHPEDANWMITEYDVGDYIELDGYHYLPEMINNNEVRVKYLDQEDIESLGFDEEWAIAYDSSGSDIVLGYMKYLNDTDSIFIHEIKDGSITESTHKYAIYKSHVYNEHSGNWDQQDLFVGTIKNKHELKRLLKQLGIDG